MARYRLEEELLSWKGVVGRKASSFAVAVASVFKEGSRSAAIMKGCLGVVIGNGERVKFWDLICDGSVPLRAAFTRVFALAANKGGFILDFGEWMGSSWEWRVDSRRQVLGWEQDQWRCFLAFLQSIVVRFSISDSLAWYPASDGLFSVKSFCI